MSANWKTAWIIGASTGIGRQLAIDLAADGVRVAISARSADKLAELQERSDMLVSFPLDIGRQDALAAAYADISRALGSVDLVVICAAMWHPMGAADFDVAKAKQSFDINVGGVHNVLGVVMPDFIARRHGHIGIVASVAGYRGLPQAAAYGSTKAALISLAESLYPDLARYGVHISIINPGFVETPMTAGNEFPMPFIMTPQAASRQIVKGLRKRRFEIAFPWLFVRMLKIARILPYSVYFWYIRNTVLKNGKN